MGYILDLQGRNADSTDPQPAVSISATSLVICCSNLSIVECS